VEEADQVLKPLRNRTSLKTGPVEAASKHLGGGGGGGSKPTRQGKGLFIPDTTDDRCPGIQTNSFVKRFAATQDSASGPRIGELFSFVVSAQAA
jgi:hypothetical protein